MGNVEPDVIFQDFRHKAVDAAANGRLCFFDPPIN